jgi:PAS domain S-box-containing protein
MFTRKELPPDRPPASRYVPAAILSPALLILLLIVGLPYRDRRQYATAGLIAAGALILLALIVAGFLIVRRQMLHREGAVAAMRGLYELGTRTMMQRDLRSVLSDISQAAQKLTAADMGNVQLLDPDGALRIAVHHGFSSAFLDFFNAVRDGESAACAVAMGSREQVVVEDVLKSPIFAGTPALDILLGAGVRAVQSTPLISSSGNFVGMLSTHYRRPRKPSRQDLRLLSLFARQAADLIENFRAAEALRESEERYHATFQNAAVGIAHLDIDGRLLHFNQALCAITGYSPDELRTTTVADITHPDDLEHSRALARRLAAGEIPTYSLEKRYIRKDRSVVWVNLTASLLREPSLGGNQIVTVIEDISERKSAEAALQSAKDQLQLVTDRMAAAVTRCSRDQRYVWVSRRCAEWLRRPLTEIIGRPIAEVLGEQGYAAIRPHIQRVLSGETVEYTAEVNYLGIGPRWIRAVYVPTYGADRQVDGWIAVIADETAERNAAEQLRQSQRLESLGVLAGGIAHDFNNILVGVLGNASLALDVLGPDTPARRMLENVSKSAERAAALTRQMLACAGEERLAIQPVDISNLVNELGALLRTGIPKNVEAKLELPPSLPYVEADQTQLHQVIMNLVINAAEAIPDHTVGTVIVSAQSRTLTAADREHAIVPLPQSQQPYVAVTVTDTGEGMSPEVRSRIFEPFFTTKFTGRGLGLSAVLGIVKAHQGAITLRSSPGSGTAITVLFPAVQPAAAPEPLPPPTAQLRTSGLVLVVDDEETVRNFVRKTLRRHGFDVLLAANGREGIQALAAHPEVAAIVLDVAMPVMSGDQAAPELRRINPAVPIILSSGYPERDVRERFTGIAGAYFLPKPYKADALIEVVSASLAANGGPGHTTSASS